VLIENFKLGGLKKYGLDYDSLSKINPRSSIARSPASARTDLMPPRAGYDFIVQGMSGMMSITGEVGREPQKVGVAVTDIFTGLYSVIAIQAALRHAEQTGEGQHVDMALFDTQISVLANQNLNYLVSGKSPVQMGNAHPNISPYEVVPVRDGHFILAVGNDGQFAKFCAIVGLEAIACRPDFSPPTGPGRQSGRLARGMIEAAGQIFAAIRCWQSWKRPACRQARSTRSARCSPTRRPSRAACARSRRRPWQSNCRRCGRRWSCRAHRLPMSAPRRAWANTRKKSLPNWRRMPTMKTGGQLIVDALEANGVDRIYCVPGESYLAVLDALHDSAIRSIVCRQEGGAAMMADCLGPADRQARHLLRHPRPRRHQRVGRPPYRHAGFDPDDPVHRPGPARRQGARSLPGNRIPPRLHRHRQMGGRDRRCRPHSGIRHPRLCGRHVGRPGPVVISLPEDMLTSEVEAPAPCRTQPVETHPGPASSKLEAAAKAPGRSSSSAARAGMPRPSRIQILPNAGRCRSAAPSAARCCSIICIRIMPAMSASASTRRWPSDQGGRLVLLIGGRIGEMPSSGYTLMKSPYPEQTLVHVHARRQ
jgi:hypothetical protein